MLIKEPASFGKRRFADSISANYTKYGVVRASTKITLEVTSVTFRERPIKESSERWCSGRLEICCGQKWQGSTPIFSAK